MYLQRATCNLHLATQKNIHKTIRKKHYTKHALHTSNRTIKCVHKLCTNRYLRRTQNRQKNRTRIIHKTPTKLYAHKMDTATEKGNNKARALVVILSFILAFSLWFLLVFCISGSSVFVYFAFHVGTLFSAGVSPELSNQRIFKTAERP